MSSSVRSSVVVVFVELGACRFVYSCAVDFVVLVGGVLMAGLSSRSLLIETIVVFVSPKFDAFPVCEIVLTFVVVSPCARRLGGRGSLGSSFSWGGLARVLTGVEITCVLGDRGHR